MMLPTVEYNIHPESHREVDYLRAKNEIVACLLDAGKLTYAKLTSKIWKDDWLRLDVEVIMREL